jgi:hypothetical protein
MKRILYSICIGSLALALTAWGQQVNDERPDRAKAHRAATVRPTRPANAGAMMSARRDMATTPVRQRTYVTPRTSSGAVVSQNARMRTLRDRSLSSNRYMDTRSDLAINRDRNVTVNRTENVAVNRQGNVSVNNNFRSGAFSGQQYTAFRDYRRQWHDRSWWRSHYDRIVFVNGGWYYWNAGYWFPAWGYDQYAYYPYDGPIYGYNGLAPDEVIVDVQEQLQRDGYYDGPIDGILGPMTRQAIADFQADNGLAVTSAIDEPTLATLGIS